MRAIILAAGRGEKMAPFGITRPKAMIPIANRPIIQHIVEGLRDAANIREFVVVVGHLSARIENCLGDGGKLGVGIKYVRQTEPRGTAQAVSLAEEKVSGDFMVVYGDIVTGRDTYRRALEEHLRTGASATLAVVKPGDASHYFGAQVAKDGDIRDIGWRNDANAQVAGIYVFREGMMDRIGRNPGIMRSVPVGMMPPMEAELNQSVKETIDSGEKVVSIEIDRYWVDVDKPWDILTANYQAIMEMASQLKEDKIAKSASISEQANVEGPLVLDEGARIGKGCYIHGPLWLGKNSEIGMNSIIYGPAVIGDNTEVKGHAIASGSIGNNVRISHGAEVNGVIMDGVYIVHYSEIAGVIGERVDIGAATVCGTLRFDNENVIKEIKGKKYQAENVAFIGDYSRTGVGAILMPGVRVGPYSIVGPGVILYRDVPPNKMVLAKQELVEKDWGPDRYGW